MLYGAAVPLVISLLLLLPPSDSKVPAVGLRAALKDHIGESCGGCVEMLRN